MYAEGLESPSGRGARGVFSRRGGGSGHSSPWAARAMTSRITFWASRSWWSCRRCPPLAAANSLQNAEDPILSPMWRGHYTA